MHFEGTEAESGSIMSNSDPFTQQILPLTIMLWFFLKYVYVVC